MAGSWTSFTKSLGTTSGQLGIIEKKYATFTADSADASIPSTSCPIKGAFLCGFGVLFGTTPPSSLDIVLTDEDGLTIATGTLSASGRGTLSTPVPILNSINIALSGNTTNSATGTLYIYFLNNIL